MSKAEIATVRSAGEARRSSLRELVQRRADDVVLAAALCKPNAVGAREFSTCTGFGQRQMLQARGAWIGERVVLGVTPIHVHALAVYFGCRACRTVACWPRVELRAELVSPNTRDAEVSWPALLLTHRSGRELAEVQVVHRDDDAWHLFTLLMQPPAPSRTTRS